MFPVQITFRHLEASPSVEERVREMAAHLASHHDSITQCHVVIDGQQRRPDRLPLFHIRIELHSPLGNVDISHDPKDLHEHADLDVALRDAFAAARRRLDDHAHRLRDEKTHGGNGHALGRGGKG